jgi:hypothetical protein
MLFQVFNFGGKLAGGHKLQPATPLRRLIFGGIREEVNLISSWDSMMVVEDRGSH